jgi:hypothetical protein
MKRCSRCGDKKPIEAFTKRKASKDGLRHRCKICEHQSDKEYRARNPGQVKTKNDRHNSLRRQRRFDPRFRESVLLQDRKRTASLTPELRAKKKARERSYTLRKKYGITLSQYLAILDSQKGRCAVCEKALKKPHVDHDHKTGRVRGILCAACNVAIAQLGDSPEGILRAMIYLLRAQDGKSNSEVSQPQDEHRQLEPGV